MPSQLPAPVPNQSFGERVIHFVVGLTALAILGSIGLVALGWGAKKIGLTSSGASMPQPPTTSQDDRWARIEAKIDEHEARWQDAALAEFRSTVSIYAAGATPSFEQCSILARSDDGKLLIVEALWFDASLPSSMAPRVSSIALIRDVGQNTPEVVQITSCPRRPDLTPSRVQGLTQLAADAKWTFENF